VSLRLRTGLMSACALIAGLAGTGASAAFWHLFGAAAPPTQDSYAYSHYFTSCLSWSFVAAYFGLSFILGWGLRRAWPLAVGMMLPLPIAFGVEVASDPTSHNLFPFEVLLYWLPAFGLALLGGYLGTMVASRLAPMKKA